jgi:hypothetical protein
LETDITQNAPEWASALSKEALGYLPAGRKQFEKLVLENLDDALAQTRERTNEQFRTFITSHKDHLKKQFDELVKSPDLAENTFADLEKDLQDDLGVSFQTDAQALLRELTNANQSFKKLREGKNLNEQEQLERRCWMLARGIVKHETLDLGTTGLPEIGASSRDKPVVRKPAGSPPTKRSPIPTKFEEEDKKAATPDKKKDAAPDSEKKKDATPEKAEGKN